MIFPAASFFRAARQLDLQIAVDFGDGYEMRLQPNRVQAHGPDLVAVPCFDPEFVDADPRTDDGALLIELLAEGHTKPKGSRK